MREIIAAAGLLALAGCGDRAGPANDQTASTPSAGARSGKWNAEDSCALLDKATVGAALGNEIVKVEAGTTTQRTKHSAGMSICYYELADGQRVAFLARQSPVPENTPEIMQRARDEVVGLAGPVQEIAGVGKSAFWIPQLRQLVVFLDEDRYFNLTMPEKLGDKDSKTLALGLATRIE